MNFDNNTNALVLGGGVSGEAAAGLLLDRGCRVVLADERDDILLQGDVVKSIADAGCMFATGRGPLPPEKFDLCVASPAFAPDHPWIVECNRRGIEIISELELGARFWKGKVLAVTGSKGKSSIVKLCADTLTMAGVSASPAGNYGIPLARLALDSPGLQWAVTEVSSFQMENTKFFCPDISILLNVQPDHLNRHGGMETYRNLKLKMFSGMKAGTSALVHNSVPVGESMPEDVKLIRFGDSLNSPWYWSDGFVEGLFNEEKVKISLAGSWFDNPVFGISAAAACCALLEAGLTISQIENGMKEYIPLEHRMERFFTSKEGVVFVNDSKATSLSALSAALLMIKTPVRLIAGGLLKEKLNENTKELLTQGVKKVYLIGDCCEQMYQAWSDTVLCVKCGTLASAVKAAFDDSGTGETVLLSPGTASFDQFSNYCERGKCFKDLVREVAN